MEPVTDCQNVTSEAQAPQGTQAPQGESAHAATWDRLLEDSRRDSLAFWATWWGLDKKVRRAMLDELEPVKG